MTDYPPLISSSHESTLLSLSSDYSLSHGLVLRPTSLSLTSSIHAPYSLYPTPFPSHLFHQALSLQKSYNELYAKITTDDQFLERVIGGNVAKVDEFQGKLYDIWKTVKQEGIKQPLSLGLFRSDYLLHAPKNKDGKEVGKEEWGLKQVEFNTISSSFGALSTRVGEMHRYLLESGHYPQHPLLNASSLPENPALSALSKGLVDAHKAYLAQQSQSQSQSEEEEESRQREKVILMVIQDNERNAFDQRLIEWEVVQKHGVKLLRIPFSSLRSSLSLSPITHKLLYTPSSPFPTSSSTSPIKPLEISLVYYRTAYSPSDYYTPKEWVTRLLIERSLAIKCPSVAMQLSGAKKVQQVLSDEKELERFVEGEEERKGMMSSWVGLWGMEDGGEGERLAREEAERFVLKPQREGGGNNIYRDDIPQFLARLEEEDQKRGEGVPKGKEGFILMELIQPPSGQEQCLVKAGEDQARRADVVSELGVYGVCLLEEKGDGRGGVEVRKNEMSGWLLRTKGRESDEGGIAVGFSVLDSPLLI